MALVAWHSLTSPWKDLALGAWVLAFWHFVGALAEEGWTHLVHPVRALEKGPTQRLQGSNVQNKISIFRHKGSR